MSLYSLRSPNSLGQEIKWVTVAEGTTMDTLKAVVPDQQFPKGTLLRFEMDLKLPVARAFDALWVPETIFRTQMPEGLALKDIHSEGSSKVVIEAEVDPIWLLTAVGFIKVHWLVISLLAIGLMFTLGFLVTAFKVKAPEEVIEKGVEIVQWVVIGGIGVGVLLLAREFVRR